MPKLVVMLGGQVQSEWPLEEKEALIGRGTDCEIHIDEPSVSRHHAKVSRIYTGFFIEDLHSTNGIILNGRRVRKYLLKDGDRVQIGTHELLFFAEAGEPVLDPDKTVVLPSRPIAARAKPSARLPTAPQPASPPQPTPVRQRRAAPPPVRPTRAYVRVLNGPDNGDSRLIDKSLYAIGEPGGNMAVISRRAQGHFLLHLGGSGVTTLNGREVHGAGVRLRSGDKILVGDTELEFYTE
jgi:pSer/pThr/pTyr-binding forkhead associated (FHA) protein